MIAQSIFLVNPFLRQFGIGRRFDRRWGRPKDIHILGTTGARADLAYAPLEKPSMPTRLQKKFAQILAESQPFPGRRNGLPIRSHSLGKIQRMVSGSGGLIQYHAPGGISPIKGEGLQRRVAKGTAGRAAAVLDQRGEIGLGLGDAVGVMANGAAADLRWVGGDPGLVGQVGQ